MSMNVQARFVGSDHWYDYGDVIHAEAAMSHCQRFKKDGEIETRYEGDDCIHRMTVCMDTGYSVRFHSGREENADD